MCHSIFLWHPRVSHHLTWWLGAVPTAPRRVQHKIWQHFWNPRSKISRVWCVTQFFVTSMGKSHLTWWPWSSSSGSTEGPTPKSDTRIGTLGMNWSFFQIWAKSRQHFVQIHDFLLLSEIYICGKKLLNFWCVEVTAACTQGQHYLHASLLASTMTNLVIFATYIYFTQKVKNHEFGRNVAWFCSNLEKWPIHT